MSSLLRFIPAGARKWVVIVFALLIVVGILARVFGVSKGIVVLGIVALLALAVLWMLIHFLSRATRKRKQRSFDASLAAKEGIEDRKREWQSWVDELEKADIDRYELPFYLLLGEPQSGKSILLQNSDLHFLFGQNRLSGVGGTRGCDWWFTQEAVILDLAGRLFTHEGGAADEAEWAAFLDLLNSFRPMDPANGIMLVIPCDSLLADSLETSRKKASQIREALFTLSRTLEAKLPIYVILTKGDKIFGFAESVHRLEAEQRKQMFGWSRPMDRLEHPFQSEELGEAWDGFVDSATSLRDSMLATARIPEAIPEVDRMMAFPSELKGMYLAVEAYMTRIFQGSDLLDQLYFRGIYLTSGLQSGAPIAKVGLEILDRPGDADNRDLETMFVRQQAYFIRDLVRKRVFAERGLVRPTGARTKRVQKNAWVGYGVAAGFAVLAAGWCAFSFLGSRSDAKRNVYGPAITAGQHFAVGEGVEKLTGIASQDDVFAALTRIEAVNEALISSEEAEERLGTQSLYASRSEPLKLLDKRLTEDLFAPSLQDAAARAMRARLAAPTTMRNDATTFVDLAEATAIMMEGFESREDAKKLLAVIPPGETAPSTVTELLEKALPEAIGAPPCEDAALTETIEFIESGWLDLTDSGSPRCLEAPLRTFVALFEVERETAKIRDWNIATVQSHSVAATCLALGDSIAQLAESTDALAGRNKEKDRDLLKAFLTERYPRIQRIRGRLRNDEPAAEQDRLDEFVSYLRLELKSLESETDPDAALGEIADARALAIGLVGNQALKSVLDAGWGQYSSTTPAAQFASYLTKASLACATPEGKEAEALPREVLIARSKTRTLASEFVGLNQKWSSYLGRTSAASGGNVNQAMWIEGGESLCASNAALQGLAGNPSAVAMGIPALRTQLIVLAEEGRTQGQSLYPADGTTLEVALSKGLLGLRDAFNLEPSGTDPVIAHAAGVLGRTAAGWSGAERDDINQAPEIAAWTVQHLEALKSLASEGLAPISDTDLEGHREQVATAAAEAITSEINAPLFEGARREAEAHAAKLSQYPSSSAAADALTELTGDDQPRVFDEWFDQLIASKGLDDTSMRSLSKLASSIEYAPQESGALTGIIKLCETFRSRSDSPLKAGVIETLRKDLRRVANVKSPADRAKTLLDLEQPSDTEPEELEATFAGALRAQLALNEQRLLRDAYFAGLDSKVKSRRKDLEVLWGGLDKPAASKQLAAMRSMFGTPDGWYPTHLSGFSARRLKDSGFDFRNIPNADGNQPNELTKIRRLDVFLEELSVYIAAPLEGEIADAEGNEIAQYLHPEPQERLAYELAPSEEFSADNAGGWAVFQGFQCSPFVEGEVGVATGESPIFKTKPVEEWSYGKLSTITMRFNPWDDLAKKFPWETSSSLAPLHFWWLANSNEGAYYTQKSGAFMLTVKEDTQVEFTISFETAPPLRPDKSDTPLGN